MPHFPPTGVPPGVPLRAQALTTREILDDLQAGPGSAIVGISSIEALIRTALH